MRRVYYPIARIYPERFRESLQKLLIYAGSRYEIEDWLGQVVLLGLLHFIILVLLPWALYGYFSVFFNLIGLGAFLMVQLIAYLVMHFRAEDRARRVERILPDALQLIASNLRAGMMPFAAIRSAARVEFGPLEEEFRIVTTKALGAKSLEDILVEMTKRIKSEMLERTIRLLSSSLKSGGQMAPLLEESARDIAETQSLKAEMITNTKNYIMFILFMIVLGTPVLLSISVHFVEIIESMRPKLGAQVPGFGMGAGISVNFLVSVSYAVLAVTTILASMMLGVITEGKEKEGFKYMPILFSLAFVVFFIGRYIVSTAFKI